MKIRLLFITACAALSAPAHASEWYREATFTCEDPLQLRAVLSSSAWLPRQPNLTFTNPAQGKAFATIEAEAANSLRTATIFGSLVLDNAKALSLRQMISQRAESYDAPVLFTVGEDILAGYLVAVANASAAGSLIFLGLRAYLNQIASSMSANYHSIAPLIAAGGKIKHNLKLGSSSFRWVLSSYYSYEVKVGNEDREVLLSTCVFPANVIFKHYMTRVGVNDLDLRKVGGVWRVYRRGQNHEQDPSYHLVETGMDGEWIYMTSNSPGSLFHNVRHRVSRTGGRWEIESDGNWVNLYTKVEPSFDP